MIEFKSFSSFYKFVQELKKDNIQYKITGHSYEDFAGVYAGFEKPENNTLFIKLLLLSSVGSFYYSEQIKLADSDKIIDIKSKLATLSITHNEISKLKDGTITIS